MASLRSGVKLTLMKKLLGIVVIGLCGGLYARLINGPIKKPEE